MLDKKKFDVIIVGAGITGSIIAKELSNKCKGLEILILEAGTGSGSDFSDYEVYNDQFYKASAKTPNAPYTDSEFAPSPSLLDLQNIEKNGPITNGYFIQQGPFPFLSNYNRNVGGTTLHWMGTCLRMVPNDFKAKTLYNYGMDWPVSYEDMMPFYRRAEFEIGVSADVKDQDFLGIHFEKGYHYPMKKIPQSYLDKHMARGLKGMTITFDKKRYPVKVISTPAGRNGMPNPRYLNEETGERGYTPVGAVGAPELGQRCEGNANCTPICPVQAKYNALKSLDAAMKSTESKVTLLNQSPVSTIEIEKGSHKVKRVHYKTYEYSADGKRTNIQSHSVEGKVVVLAAHAIENAKILMASDACKSSGQVGKNLMDHLCTLTWGLFPRPIGAYRGPGSTSGMPLTRDGSFRKRRSAFRIEIGNWGWTWPAFAPESTLLGYVNDKGKFGKDLIRDIYHETSRQFRIAWEVEQIPQEINCISIDPKYRDDLGNFRPIIKYHIDEKEKIAALEATKMSAKVFKRLKVESRTEIKETDPGYFEYRYKENGKVKVHKNTFNGAGHVVGTHRMGKSKRTSVVDSNQRAHDHKNLFVAGCGSFPTLATSNPTLTMAALAYRTADAIKKEFNQ